MGAITTGLRRKISPAPESFVIFVHGFGVDKTDRGLFSDILGGLDGVIGVMFNNNEVDEMTGEITVRPLSDQAQSLMAVIKTVRERSEEPIDLICHSQSCLVAGIAAPRGIRNTIMLTPSFAPSAKRTAKTFGSRKGSIINMKGESKLARSDGTFTTVPREYWGELDQINAIDLYNQLAQNTALTMILARQDEILADTRPDNLTSHINVLKLDGDHNFTGANRGSMITVICRILAR